MATYRHTDRHSDSDTDAVTHTDRHSDSDTDAVTYTDRHSYHAATQPTDTHTDTRALKVCS